MKRIRIMGLCLVAAMAMCVTAVSVASAAAPEFITKANWGEVAGAGGPVALKSVPLIGMAGAQLEGQVSKVKIPCLDKVGASAIGEVTGPKTTKQNVTVFTECSSPVGACASAGEPAGTIKTEALEGTLGNLPTGKPGERFFNEATPRTGVIAKFECGGGLLKIESVGSIVAELSITGSGATPATTKLEKSNKVSFAESKGIQKYKEAESPPSEQLETNGVLTIAETTIEWPWTGSEVTKTTIKIKCGSGEGFLGELVDSHYAPTAPFKLPVADGLKYYTSASITKYEETMYYLVVMKGYPVATAESVASGYLVETAEYGPCAGTERSGETFKVSMESTPKEDIGYTL